MTSQTRPTPNSPTSSYGAPGATGGAARGASLDPTGTYLALKEKDLRLQLTADKTGLLAGPRHKLTDELREAIEANRDPLLRSELFSEAVRCLHEELLRREGATHTRAAAAAYGAMTARLEEVEEAWHQESVEGFKATLRRWLRTGQHVYRDALRTASTDPSPDAPTNNAHHQPGLHPHSETPTLEETP